MKAAFTAWGKRIAPVFEVAYLAGQYHETVSNYAQAQTEIEQALEAARNRGDMVGEVRCLEPAFEVAD